MNIFKFFSYKYDPNDFVPGELSVAVPAAVILKDSTLTETA